MAKLYPVPFEDFIQEAILTGNNALSQGLVDVRVGAIAKRGAISEAYFQDDISNAGSATFIASSSTSVTAQELSDFKVVNTVLGLGFGLKEAGIDTLRRGSDGLRTALSQVGRYAIDETQPYVLGALTAAFGSALASSHLLAGIQNEGDGTITPQAINKARKYVMGEYYQQMDTIVMHTEVHTDLTNLGLVKAMGGSQFGLSVLANGTLGSAPVETILGMRIVINDTICPTETVDGDTVYPVYVMNGRPGQRPFKIEYQSTLRSATDVVASKGGITNEEYFYWDFAPYMVGCSWGNSVGPTSQADFEDSSNWSKVFDNKNIPICKFYVKKAS